jgi:hypothetical protein
LTVLSAVGEMMLLLLSLPHAAAPSTATAAAQANMLRRAVRERWLMNMRLSPVCL